MHLGILGGGQLARMLAEAALRRGHEVSVTSASNPTSAAIPTVEVVDQPSDDGLALQALIDRGATCITIENEFLDTDRIERCLKKNPHVSFYPRPKSIAVAQDKLRQKELFSALSIPTAAFELIDPRNAARSVRDAMNRFDRGVMLKWSRFGYDGKGNLLLQPDTATNSERLGTFVADAADREAEIYAEELVAFEHEVAMVATRSADGDFVSYPLVYSVQEHSVCCEVYGPCIQLGIDSAVESQARETLRAIGEHLGFVGTFAVEFFVEADGRLLANEMAPRVHNSGHYTLYSTEHSQFDAHIEAITHAPLSKPGLSNLFLMRNFLGIEGFSRAQACHSPTAPAPGNSEVYWYEKGGASKGRKMGHMTGRASTQSALADLRGQFKNYEREYWARHKNGGM